MSASTLDGRSVLYTTLCSTSRDFGATRLQRHELIYVLCGSFLLGLSSRIHEQARLQRCHLLQLISAPLIRCNRGWSKEPLGFRKHIPCPRRTARFAARTSVTTRQMPPQLHFSTPAKPSDSARPDRTVSRPTEGVPANNAQSEERDTAASSCWGLIIMWTCLEAKQFK